MIVEIDPWVVVAILGLVNFVKQLGASGKVLTLISMGIGVVVSVAFALLPPDASRVLLLGIIAGLGACGLYDLGGMLSNALGGGKKQ